MYDNHEYMVVIKYCLLDLFNVLMLNKIEHSFSGFSLSFIYCRIDQSRGLVIATLQVTAIQYKAHEVNRHVFNRGRC